jgi:hypothetical protein
MKKQPYPITELTGGINVDLDPSFIANKESPNARLCRFEKGLVKKDFGRREFGLPVLGTPLLQEKYYKTNGDVVLLLLTTTSFYQWNESKREWEDITPYQSISECSDLGTASSEVTITNPAGKRGSYCAQISIGASFTTGLAARFPIYV